MKDGVLSWKQLLNKGVCKGKNLKGETEEAFLAKQTHLSLDGRQISSLGSALKAAPRTQVLYLFDNELHSLRGLSTVGLTHLYLQNNQLVDSPELGDALSALHHLQKLYISGNRLADLAPLCALPSLEELHAGSQRGGGELVLPKDLDLLIRWLPSPNECVVRLQALHGLGHRAYILRVHAFPITSAGYACCLCHTTGCAMCRRSAAAADYSPWTCRPTRSRTWPTSPTCWVRRLSCRRSTCAGARSATAAP